jgi:hypothetical protein
MMLPVEIVACLAAIGGAVKFATVEYSRLRKQRQMSHAQLLRALR